VVEGLVIHIFLLMGALELELRIKVNVLGFGSKAENSEI
jgi:hypothetical protein